MEAMSMLSTNELPSDEAVALALSDLDAFLDGRMTVELFCGTVAKRCRDYDAAYSNDDLTDLSNDLLWFFSSEAYGLCSRLPRNLASEQQLKDVLVTWRPHLVLGAHAWRTVVDAGGWPIEWGEDDEQPRS